jgi:cellobiose phosphorylase
MRPRVRPFRKREAFPVEQPLRSELFSSDQLQRHAADLAQQHRTAPGRGRDRLLPRLSENERLLWDFNKATLRVEERRRTTPATEWLIDNCYLIEEQIRTARRHFPRRYSRELPHLAPGPLGGYPRVYDIALEYVAHVDGRMDAAQLTGFVVAYQNVTRLKLGELWAIPIMLRLALIENLRRIAVLLTAARRERDQADAWADQMAETAENDPAQLITVVGEMAREHTRLTRTFVAEFYRRLHQKSPTLNLAFGWIEQRLAIDGRTMEQLVQSESQDQAANQVSVANSINSLRLLDAIDWEEFVETLSAVEQTLRTDPAGIYNKMDFRSRDTYRHAVERIARSSPVAEWDVAAQAVEFARQHASNAANDPRVSHVGFFLVDEGLSQLEREVQMRPDIATRIARRWNRLPLAFYLVPLLCFTLLTTLALLPSIAVASASGWMFSPLLAVVAIGASQLAVSLVNWLVTLVFPRLLPRVDFSEGVPANHSTLVVVPTMLTSADGIDHLLEDIEIRYLANRDPNIYFALLTDFRDAPTETTPEDDGLLRHASEGIRRLNKRYGEDRACVFFLFHRPRRWNPAENVWMGYERKRGKLVEFNGLLRGRNRDCFSKIEGDLSSLPRIKYVITLDTDTQLPRDAAHQLIGTMAHPLNQPQFDSGKGRVMRGYGVLQPRVAVNLVSASRTRFAKLFAGEPGLDPYTRAVSDVYQDLFREGSFIGKGIYDVDIFQQTVGRTFPPNRILSHDLLESGYARSGLVSDVQLYEEHPARYMADVNRRHRWIRGDWQIAAWVLPKVPSAEGKRVVNPLSGLARWKIFDNLRRSLVPLALLLLVIVSWVAAPSGLPGLELFVLLVLTAPVLLSTLLDLARKPRGLFWTLHLRQMGKPAARQAGQAFCAICFLPCEAFVSLDAILRTLGRLFITHRRLLEWQTASEAAKNSPRHLLAFARAMWVGPALGIALAAGLAGTRPDQLWWAAPLLALWIISPAVAWWISRPLVTTPPKLSEQQLEFLHQRARKTWRFFETFVTGEENWLPPDNYQEHPGPLLAERTSPTNIGLSLLSNLAAWDFGYIPGSALLQRVENTLATLTRMERHEEHFYNWYETRTLRPLAPLYLSTVDNGNFVGLLLTLQSGLVETAGQNILPPQVFSGLRTTVRVLRDEIRSEAATGKRRQASDGMSRSLARLKELDEALSALPSGLTAARAILERTHAIAAEIKAALADFQREDVRWWSHALEYDCRVHLKELDHLAPWIPLLTKLGDDLPAPVRQLLDAIPTFQEVERLPEAVASVLKDASGDAAEPIAAPAKEAMKPLRGQCHLGSERATQRIQWSEDLARRCGELADLDFTLLYDSSRELFSIGYNASHHRLDATCYDLLASEARLVSYVAIATGQMQQKHWFAMGRLLVSQAGVPTLISWSGSMFEYLMPMLIMPAYENTLLDVSCKGAVARQIEYGNEQGVPWGMSESGYNLTDAKLNYQYRAFGVPGLGLKRGLAEDLVVAPYASVLALMISPEEACRNLERLAAEGREGRYGFYEAADYTPARLPPNETSVTVQSYMAHHQAMSFLSFAWLLLGRPMQRRFRSNPLLKASELLLQERVPKQTTVLQTEDVEVRKVQRSDTGHEPKLRVFKNPGDGPPEVHLLSNGRCHSMVTSAGGGYCRWKDIALTRWHEDPTRDCWGAFLYLRDMATGEFWSATHQPVRASLENYEAVFSQGRAEYRGSRNKIDTHLQICISPEDDVEVRHLTVVNRSEVRRTIELTSFAEVALNTTVADLAHPAFSKLFVQTEILRDHHAILCSRRRRAPGEEWPWMFHLMLVQGKERREASFETDRARFIGRGRTATNPAALHDRATAALSNSHGSVLDPCVAVRRTIQLGPNEEAQVTVITGVAADRQTAQSLIEKYQDIQLAERALELSWTHGLVVLRHLNATEMDAQLFGRLASGLVFASGQRRANPSVIAQNRRGQSNLWSYGISGDLPIVLVRIHTADGIELVRQLLQAHAYWRLKGLSADLVIVNEDDSNYRQSLHDQIMGLVASGLEAQVVDKPGGVFVRRLELVSYEDLTLLQAVARISFSDEKGTVTRQLQRRRRPELALTPPKIARARTSQHSEAVRLQPRDLVFFNGLGGFTRDGREYVITLHPGQTTPAPWVNVIANPDFGAVVSESGSAYTWFENSHEFRLTPWHNDPITDLTGEAFYIRDERTGQFWSPAPGPACGATPYVTRHGFGYTVFEHTEAGIASELCLYVATDAPVKFAVLKLRNKSGQGRSLSLTGYWEWVLGESRSKNLMHVVTEVDPQSQALLARNSYNTDFPERVAFVDVSGIARSVTGDRGEFVGRNSDLTNPAAMTTERLSGKVGAGLDPCGAVQVKVELARDEEREIVFRLGAARSVAQAQELIQRFREPGASRNALESVWSFWNRTLTAVQIETPDLALNPLANGWLVYQTLSCRLWGRTGFYQSGGAFGFRDQLQDVMALVHSQPALVREHLLRAAAHQFLEGDVQHWWHPPTQRGVRTRFSDDYLWLPYVAAHYVRTTGDTGVLDEKAPFLESRALRPEEEAFYDRPQSSGEAASLYEHCVRAIKNGLRFGEHGLPLMGCGDWNDGMNLVGIHGRGESVWLAFFLHDVLERFLPLARGRHDDGFAAECVAHAAKLQENIELHAWDGQWYRRAYFDNGEPLGSAVNPECQIDSLPQSWSVISDAGTPDRRTLAMNAVSERLVRRHSRILQLFDPPFDKSPLEPGYIKGYLPGVRENGGQYTHAAVWTIMAFALMGDHKRAWDLFSFINPVLHATTPESAARYKAEPYVVAADVYGAAPHTGRGGWTWYTGSAGWLYRLILEVLLGVEVKGDRMKLTPRLPPDWPGCEIRYRYRETNYRITVSCAARSAAGAMTLSLDGETLSGPEIPLCDDRKEHRIVCQIT